MREFESLAAHFSCKQNAVLFAEKQKPSNILFLLDGNVKLTMNSILGERLTLATATPGEILGLAATLGGSSYEMTAIALFPCRIDSLPRQSFLDFLFRYPVAMRNSARLLCAEYKRGCEQLLQFGLA
jgi:CRP/FNR family transcriptional regulator